MIGKVGTTMLSLAIAGSLTLSAFETSLENFAPEKSMGELKKEKAAIKAAEKNRLSEKKLENINLALSTMYEVNIRTKQELLPALDSSLQRWYKSDGKGRLLRAIEWFGRALDTRLKQYENMHLVFSKNNIPRDMKDRLAELERMTKEAKQTPMAHKRRVAILDEAKEIQNKVRSLDILSFDDYWVPSFDDKGCTLCLHDNRSAELGNVDGIAEKESEINSLLDPKKYSYIDTVVII